MKKILIIVLILLSSCSTESIFIVSNVVDGDTLDVDIGRVRLSGINTPETGQCYYQEAKDALKNLTLNKEVVLEKDVDNYDKYGRLLRYVYVNETFVNGYLVENGYAIVFDRYNETTNRYDELKELENIAKENKLGVWSCESSEECLYVASKNSKTYHKPDCKWAKRIKPENKICIKSEEELVNYEPCSTCSV